MADVAVTMRISTTEQDIIEAVEEKIKSTVRVHSTQIDNIGFGIKVIKAIIFVDDKVEGMDNVEDKIKNIEGVGEIEVLSMDRQD